MQRTHHYDIRRTRALAPSAGAVQEGLKDELAALVRRRLGEDGDDECGCAAAVPPDRDVIQMPQEVYAKGVDEPCSEN